MAKFKHVTSGATVEVRDDKVMDSQWESVGDSGTEKKAPAKKAAATKPSSTKSE